MFSFFKKAKINRINDSIYVKRTIADVAVINKHNELIRNNPCVYVIYFFENSKKRLDILLNETQIDKIYNAEKISSSLNTKLIQQQIKNPHFIFLEHHPHFEYEQKIINEFELMFKDLNPTIEFYGSLDEAYMEKFNSQNIIKVMEQLGLKEDEMLSHNMITKAITNAQKKISESAKSELSADSQEEWLRINL